MVGGGGVALVAGAGPGIGCPKLCEELYELPKNLEKRKKEKIGEENEEKKAKKVKGVFAKVKIGPKKSS